MIFIYAILLSVPVYLILVLNLGVFWLVLTAIIGVAGWVAYRFDVHAKIVGRLQLHFQKIREDRMRRFRLHEELINIYREANKTTPPDWVTDDRAKRYLQIQKELK